MGSGDNCHRKLSRPPRSPPSTPSRREGQALDFSGVSELDVSGEHALRLVLGGVRHAGTRLVLENVNAHVVGVLERSRFLQEPGVSCEGPL